jgi:translation initiation factor IF-2
VPNDEDTLAHPEQPRFLLSAWLWAVMLFVSFGLIVAIAFGAMSRGSSFEEDRAKTRAEKLKTAQDEWNKTAQSYGWIDKAKGVAHIPVDRAMALELADLQANKPVPAGPIVTPTPAAAPATTNETPSLANPPAAASAPVAAPKAESEAPPTASPGATILKPAATPSPSGGGEP